jgi:ABC-2 type transport system ATP-binding protein
MEKAFQYINTVKTFQDFKLGPIDLDLEPGTVLGLIGPNGAGKTTLIQCLVGLLRPDSGEIRVFGRLNDLNNPLWKLDIGYVGELHPFWDRWSGAKNLQFLSRFYPDWSQKKVAELAERFRFPLGKRVKDLSTGNRVKLSLIRALAQQSRLLLLDEPTTGLDPVVRAEVQDVLFETIEAGDRAILYATHVLSEISRLADELVFLDEGRIRLRTSKEELTERWRKISFRLSQKPTSFESFTSHRAEGTSHRVISSNYPATLRQLRELGAEDIQDTPMTIDEIAVQILKGGAHA